MTRRIGKGLAGPGFVGAHHVDAVRRLGFVDVVAVCAATQERAAAKATALGVPKAYDSVEALAADPDIHIVHVITPHARAYAHLPGGHQEACDSAMATFEDGYRAACVVDAVLDSHRQGGVWTGVRSAR